jgi:dihydroorotase
MSQSNSSITNNENLAANQEPTALIHARIIDPESGRDEMGGLLIENGIITDVGSHLSKNAPGGTKVVDCAGHVLCPGLIDMLVFTGEPGEEHRETLASASRAAAAGGVTTMVCMPNTDPVIDEVALVDFLQRRARDTAIVRVNVMAAMTKELKGDEMTEIGLLLDAGAIAFTNGKNSVTNAQVMRRILSYGKDFDALIVHYTEDPDLRGNGVMNEGEVSSRLGLPGISTLAETIMLERDMRLAADTGARYHNATISCTDSLNIIREAKQNGTQVSSGVSINHLTLNENDIGPYRTFCKVRPPLRKEEDRVAMVEGLRNGDIDVIVSAHDPKDAEVKRQPFAEAAYGAVGVETLLPAALRLYHNQEIELSTLLAAMTINPAKILGLDNGRIAPGAPADLTLFDLNTPWIIDRDLLQSRSKNSAFDESKVEGRVLKTFVNGKMVYEFGKTGPTFTS